MSEPTKRHKPKLYSPALLRGTEIKFLSCIGRCKIRSWFSQDTEFAFDEAMNSQGPDTLRATKGVEHLTFEIQRKTEVEEGWDVTLTSDNGQGPLKGYVEGDRFIIHNDKLQLQLQCFHADNKERDNEQSIYSKIADALDQDRLRVYQGLTHFGKGLRVFFPSSRCTKFTLSPDRSYVAEFTVGQCRLSVHPHDFPMVIFGDNPVASQEKSGLRVLVYGPGDKFVAQCQGNVNHVIAQIRRYLVAIPF